MCTNKFILFCMGIVMSVSSSAWAGDDIPLYKDRTSPIEKRVDDLMSRMTLHEKVLQLQNRASGSYRITIDQLKETISIVKQ